MMSVLNSTNVLVVTPSFLMPTYLATNAVLNCFCMWNVMALWTMLRLVRTMYLMMAVTKFMWAVLTIGRCSRPVYSF